jgi:DNA-binding CsgD family transcriptional regulator/PAS domain-containing protein
LFYAFRPGTNYKKNGSPFYNELTIIASIKDQSGKEAYRIWCLRDVTDFVEAEKKTALLIAEKDVRFSAYMENSNEAIWRIDFDPPISIDAPEAMQVQEVFDSGIFTEANDVTAHIYGYSKGEKVCGRPLKEFMEKSNPENVAQVVDLVQKKFLIDNFITCEKDSNNTTNVILNNITPNICENKVLHIWGASLDVSELFKTQENLRDSEEKLAFQKMELEEKNIALKVVIGQVELEKRELKDRVMANIENVILPSLEKIRFNKGEDTYIEQHRIALENLTSSFGKKISNNKVKLSRREMEVCGLVKNGMVNKDIASMLNIAVHTVEKHRRMVRKKLGVANKGINLNTYLNSL